MLQVELLDSSSEAIKQVPSAETSAANSLYASKALSIRPHGLVLREMATGVASAGVLELLKVDVPARQVEVAPVRLFAALPVPVEEISFRNFAVGPLPLSGVVVLDVYAQHRDRLPG